MDKKIIAERSLLYSPKGKNQLRNFRICVYKPYLLTREEVNYKWGDQDLYVCEIKSIGLEKEISHETYGGDTLEAIHIAARSVDSCIKRLNKNLDIFYPDGEPYFDKII